MTFPRFNAALTAVLLATISACAPDVPMDPQVITRADGVREVRYGVAGFTHLTAGPPAWIARDGTTPLIGWLVDWELGRDGDLFLADAQDNVIHVFRAAASRWERIGRSGEGPGEFTAIAAIATDAANRLWVADGQQRRLTVFDSTGALDTILPWPVLELDVPTSIQFAEDGAMLGRGNIRTGPRQFAQVLIRFDPTQGEPSSIQLADLPQQQYEVRDSAGRLRLRTPVPLTPRLAWSIDSDGSIVWAHTNSYRIVRQQPGGDTLVVIERASVPRPVDEAAIDGLLKAAIGDDWRLSPDVDPARIPRTHPVLQRVIAGESGEIAVELPRDSANVSTFELYDANGLTRGAVSVNVHFSTRHRLLLRDGALIGVAEDEDGVPWIMSVALPR